MYGTVSTEIAFLLTAWKVSKYGAFSGPHSPVLGLNTEKYRKNSVFGYFTLSDWLDKFWNLF